jgi:DnaJ like chaperone protein
MLYQFLNTSYKQAVTARLNGCDLDVAVPHGGRAQELVNQAMFMLLGKVAKLDGRVTTEDIGYATLIMNLLDLGETERRNAVADFNRGKLWATDVNPVLKNLVQHIGRRNELVCLFMKIQCQAACVYGGMGLPKKVFLRGVAEIFGYDKIEFQEVCNESRKFCSSGSGSNWSSISEAYDVLQLAPGVNDEEIKRAYRRLVSRHHPDKLNTQNLSEDALRSAQEQFTSIRSAYEILCGKRKIRA